MTLNSSNLASLVKFTVGDNFGDVDALTLSSNGSGTLLGPMTYTIGTGLVASEGVSQHRPDNQQGLQGGGRNHR